MANVVDVSGLGPQTRIAESTTSTGTRISRGFSTAAEEIFPFDDLAVVIVASFLISFLVLGFIGNLLTMLVICTSKTLTNVFNLFIISLCASDITSSLISWINLYRRTWGFNTFRLPNFFCWLYWGADMWTSYVTAQHILSFAILRLWSVWKPVSFSKIKTLHARIWIVMIWVVAFACGFIPFAIFSGAKVRDRSDRSSPTARWPSCTQNNETIDEYSEYIKYAYPVFFYIPLVAIIVVSTSIGLVIVTRKTPQQKFSHYEMKKKLKERQKEKQAILQLALIVGSFMVGYLPFTIYEFYTLYNTDESDDGWKKEWLFGTIQYMCLRFSECLNPVFYNLASTKLRKETVAFLRRWSCKEKGPESEDKSTGISGLDA